MLLPLKYPRQTLTGIYLRKYLIREDSGLSTRIVPSSEVSERTTNFHVFEPQTCGNDYHLEGKSFVIPASLKWGPVFLNAWSEAPAMWLTGLYLTNALQVFHLKCFLFSQILKNYWWSEASCLEWVPTFHADIFLWWRSSGVLHLSFASNSGCAE